MGRKKKPRRRDVYSLALVFPDGSVFSCGPQRKPSSKRLNNDDTYVDEDFVFKECKYGVDEWSSWPIEQRTELCQTMAIRLNTRRAIRELVLPELESIKAMLVGIQQRLAKIEMSVETQSTE